MDPDLTDSTHTSVNQDLSDLDSMSDLTESDQDDIQEYSPERTARPRNVMTLKLARWLNWSPEQYAAIRVRRCSLFLFPCF